MKREAPAMVSGFFYANFAANFHVYVISLWVYNAV